MKKTKPMTKRLTLERESVRTLLAELAQGELRYVRGGKLPPDTSTASSQQGANDIACG